MFSNIQQPQFVSFTILTIIILVLCTAAFGQANVPKPMLQYIGSQVNEWQGRMLTQYKFEIVNRSDFPDELFAASPDLPPCGKNANSSRTWINIYDGNGKRIYGFCAIKNNSELAQISFNLQVNETPPDKVYIDMVDRRTGTIYKSKRVKITP